MLLRLPTRGSTARAMSALLFASWLLVQMLAPALEVHTCKCKSFRGGCTAALHGLTMRGVQLKRLATHVRSP